MAVAVKPVVLVVDDVPANIQILLPLLKDEYRVLVATNGEKGLALATGKVRPDLILLDIMMPGIDGYEVCERLKANPEVREIPVVFITAMSEVEDETRGFDVGAVDYITKPFSPPIVQARVRTHVTNHRMKLQIQEQKASIEAKNAENERLLLNILPKSIADRLKAGESIIADSFPAVTVLFADLVGFTRMSSTIGPEALVAMLNELFSEFDALARRYQIEKIKTIGDCYMAVSGVPIAQDGHASAVATMALGMLDSLNVINERRGSDLELRIGLNTGPVVAGIIGSTKFAYDLWGDTVNTASRMESSGSPGRVHVSAATAAAMGDGFQLEARGEIEVAGKGTLSTFWLARLPD
jgi:adenylate cyclase